MIDNCDRLDLPSPRRKKQKENPQKPIKFCPLVCVIRVARCQFGVRAEGTISIRSDGLGEEDIPKPLTHVWWAMLSNLAGKLK
jgi:hypothetical protein